ncbi:MAG: hypothetical protein J7604_00025 [Sporocytophaga sp.]|uniref:hypothetical protein n=1 Tax=Sporocytophaga sp. TaxID=2231183 RepID=UPI001B1ECE2C|nr:hypothetical protein [Sporocytophaga sp.]MBO9698557.1 hypothetical protein [Sporocytophaga sp.]
MKYINSLFLFFFLLGVGCMSPYKEQYSNIDSTYLSEDTLLSVSDTLNDQNKSEKVFEPLIVKDLAPLSDFAPLYKYPYSFEMDKENRNVSEQNDLRLDEACKYFFLEKLQSVLEKHYTNLKEIRNIFKDSLSSKVIPLGQFKYPGNKFNSQLMCINVERNERAYDFVLLVNRDYETLQYHNSAIVAMKYGGAEGDNRFVELSSKFDVDSTGKFIHIDQILEEADAEINNEEVPMKKKDIKIQIKIDSCPDCERIPEDFIKYVKE